MERCEVVGWHNPSCAVVEKAKWFNREEFALLEPVLGGNPSLWKMAKRYFFDNFNNNNNN
jgi:hypothetical protein